jgi:hypothetical protein
MTLTPRRHGAAALPDGWNVQMNIARILIASVVAAASVLAAGAMAEHSAASMSHKTVIASPVPCCDIAHA